MRTKNSFKYVKVVQHDLKYQIVAIPYKKRDFFFTSYMVYLIPSTHEIDLSKLWDNFYRFSEGFIGWSFVSWRFKKIDLHVPPLENVQSSFNLVDLFYDVYKYNECYNLNCSMTTYLNVDENGDQETDDTNDDYSDEIICIKANRPHISFVFEMASHRILMLTKDTGIINTE